MDAEKQNEEPKVYIQDDSSEDWFLDEDRFKDENINETIKEYNYDYKALMRELSLFLSYDKLIEILGKCGVSMEEYLSPTYETFEIIRNIVINGQ